MQAQRTGWLLVIIAAGGALRIVGLSTFIEVLPDEGLWTNSTKNFVMFGDWFMGERTHFVLSPLFHALSLVSFETLGSGIASARIVSALSGILSIPLLYVLVKHLGGPRDLALTAVALLAFNQTSIVIGRVAMIEALQCAMLLLTAVLAAAGGWVSIVLAGVCAGLALLAKVNSAIVLLVIGTCLAWPFTATRIRQAAAFGFVGLGVAAAVYSFLYISFPEQFKAAFLWELDGVHFESVSDPIFRFGRFGLDPIKVSRTIIALMRESPFLMVLALAGLVANWLSGARRSLLMYAWLIAVMIFFLAQMYQPLRYFTLAIPPMCYFAALAIHSLASTEREDRTRLIRLAMVAVYACFGLGHFLGLTLASPARRVAETSKWAREHTTLETRSLCATQICTDLPHRAYDFYPLARTPDQLREVIQDYEIEYVFLTDGDWPDPLRAVILADMEKVSGWSFGAVYRTSIDRKQ